MIDRKIWITIKNKFICEIQNNKVKRGKITFFLNIKKKWYYMKLVFRAIRNKLKLYMTMTKWMQATFNKRLNCEKQVK